jgi:hypothetical protein
MKRLLDTCGFAPLLLLFPLLLVAQESPPILDCTGPTGADAKTVLAAQQAWARHLGEASHEKSFPLDKTGKVTVEMILLPLPVHNPLRESTLFLKFRKFV